MINKKRLGALLLAGTMLAGMSTTVFAKVPTVGNQEGTETIPATATITKDFEMAEGLDVPSVTFQFEVVKAEGNTDGPDATIQPVTYSGKDEKGTAENGKYVISKDAAITFGTFPHAGEYVYTVSEKKESAEGVTYSAETYTLRVQVANGVNNGLYVKSITAEKGTNTGSEANKVAKILFTNTYRKNTSLMIEKKTTGELADKTKQFNFTITFEKSATEDVLDDFSGTITRKDGTTTENVVCKNGTATFTLADGDRLVFENLPAGTKYKVTEEGKKMVMFLM